MQTTTRCLRTAVLAFLAASAACTGLATEAEPGTPVGALVLDVREQHGPDGLGTGTPVPALLLETARMLGQGGTVHANVQVSGAGISVHVDSVVDCTGICLTANAPALGAAMLPVGEGEYTLAIAADGRTDHYRLVVTGELLELLPVDADFTTVRSGRAWRYPPRSMAVMCYLGMGGSGPCAALHTRLAERVALEPLTFSAGATNPFAVNGISAAGNWAVEHYRYAAEADFGRAGVVLAEVLDEHTGAWIVMRSWTNGMHRRTPVPD